MSLYPLMIDGRSISALIVGGGAVAARKASALVGAGARVRIVAPHVAPELEALASKTDLIEIRREPYAVDAIGDALLVIAATDDAATNSRVAHDARELGRLANVAGAPQEGNCITPAWHACGDVVIAVSAGGVPSAAARIRDRMATAIDDRYATAIKELSTLRRALLEGGQRERWAAVAAAVIDNEFCDRVESGRLTEALAEWR